MKQCVPTWQHEKPFVSSGNNLGDMTENVGKQELWDCYLNGWKNKSFRPFVHFV